ncbi:MAG: phosphatidylserine decarboxylase family protein [Ignavibacteria bacterium]|nr:phosphatidylserine decarboxylase family protein [Ignavibacteria bacterium]
MGISKYGIDNFLVGVVISLFIIFLPIIFVLGVILSVFLWLIGFALLIFTFWFFRDPKRNVPLLAIEDGSIILAPADGKVIQIIEMNENLVLNQKVQVISIFLSPLDVHINRSPITGKVFFFKYFPGKYLVAFHPKASEENEHTFIGIQNEFGAITFKQIAGILARRVVCTLKEGDEVCAGDKIGMMKFGSRMDVMVPFSSRIFVKVGDKVKGGETIIARLRKEYEFPNI